ncbi:hypothetical protein F511_44330 [Dorcoceras hygrometricum]|uniref:Uncharacterized protein n=1 Tax=Dorcoceras hygrometricum TaxID=472368 RepID=A0A2Z7B5Y0_9LAMI|nr:hypothetical protein F511_44330 [Dorcoceras hygrometricum]
MDDFSSDVIIQQELQLKIQQMRRGASFGMSCDDISLDVITISRWSKAQTLKRRRVLNQQMKPNAKSRCDVVLEISRCY